MNKERERIYLTDEELENFDFTGGSKWELRGETYNFVEIIRTDQYSDGPSWDTVVKRQSDGKYFKWNCWDAGDYNGYMMEDGDNYIEETFPKTITTTIFE
jgi:hypothetical protein